MWEKIPITLAAHHPKLRDRRPRCTLLTHARFHWQIYLEPKRVTWQLAFGLDEVGYMADMIRLQT